MYYIYVVRVPKNKRTPNLILKIVNGYGVWCGGISLKKHYKMSIGDGEILYSSIWGGGNTNRCFKFQLIFRIRFANERGYYVCMTRKAKATFSAKM